MGPPLLPGPPGRRGPGLPGLLTRWASLGPGSSEPCGTRVSSQDPAGGRAPRRPCKRLKGFVPAAPRATGSPWPPLTRVAALGWEPPPVQRTPPPDPLAPVTPC